MLYKTLVLRRVIFEVGVIQKVKLKGYKVKGLCRSKNRK